MDATQEIPTAHHVPIEGLMKTDQENGIETRSCPACGRSVIDREIGLLRARVWERSVLAMRMRRTQDIIAMATAIVLGSFWGWVMMR